MDKGIINFVIGIILLLAGALFMFIDYAELPVRITIGILGIILVANNNPKKK